MEEIPRSHPRYYSLKIRENLGKALDKGFVHRTGLIAHGRGEAFDYLLGEKTISFAEDAEKTAAAALLKAKNPVISVNGNVVALVAKDCVNLADLIPAKIEINLFHRDNTRINSLYKELKRVGATEVFGLKGDARIPNLSQNRGLCDKEGIYSADVVLVPLEDGDRCQALRDIGKIVIAIDLNPISRTAKTASITIVDNVVRAIPNIVKWVKILKEEDKPELIEKLNKDWDNDKKLKEVYSYISKRLNSLS